MPEQSVLITGSSRGFGRELALRFATEGGFVIVHGTDAVRMATVEKEIRALGAGCETVFGNLMLDSTLDCLADAARRHDVDVLINNAGIYANMPFERMTDEIIRKVIAVNLIAPVLLVRRLWPLFSQKQSGLVVNINSFAGKAGSDGESAYCASKHGLRGFARSLQFDATRGHLRVIDVFLGKLNTDMVAGRQDPEKSIRTDDAADLVWRICREYPSMRIEEVHLSRRWY